MFIQNCPLMNNDIRMFTVYELQIKLLITNNHTNVQRSHTGQGKNPSFFTGREKLQYYDLSVTNFTAPHLITSLFLYAMIGSSFLLV